MQRRSHIIGTAYIALAAIVPALAIGQNYYTPSQSWSSGVSRADFVRMVLEDKGMPLSGTRCFTDVGTQAFAPYVCAAKRDGLVTGDPSGRFRPNDMITVVEAAAVLVRAEGVWPPKNVIWYKPYIDQLGLWHAIPSVVNVLDRLTYDQAIDMIEIVRDRGNDFDDRYEDEYEDYYDDRYDDRNDDRYKDRCDDYYDSWCEDDFNDDEVSSDRDLKITLTSSDDSPEPGDRITYRIRLENISSSEMRNARISALLDPGMEFVSTSDNGDDYSDEVEWDSLRIPARNTKTLLLTVEIDDNARDGDTLKLEIEGGERVVRHTVRVNDDGGDTDGIRISITDSPDPVDSGDEVTYRITFRNMDNKDVTFSPRAFLDGDTDLVYVSDGGEWTGSTVRWDNIKLDDDEERTFTLRVRVDRNVNDGDRLLLAVEAGDVEDEEETLVDDNTSSNNNNNDNDEDVSISMLDAPDPAWPGEQVVYRITLRNNENHDVRLDVRSYLDGNTSFLTASDSGFLESNGQVFWRDVEVRRNESRVILLTLRIREQAPRNGNVWTRVKAGDDERTEPTNIR